jgi:probable phosphoglycerate mutase
LIQLDSIHNHYFLLRHGQSEANVLEIIVSNPVVGVEKYGLTPAGRSQITSSVQHAKAQGQLDSSTLIYSSDFKRCRESAEIAFAILACPPPHFTPALRERYFGTWDLTHHSNYQQVWSLDEQDPTHTTWNVESTVAVLQRTTALIHELEALYHAASILLISHGDALQILQTAFEHVSPALHRHLPPLATAEIRRLAGS